MKYATRNLLTILSLLGFISPAQADEKCLTSGIGMLVCGTSTAMAAGTLYGALINQLQTAQMEFRRAPLSYHMSRQERLVDHHSRPRSDFNPASLASNIREGESVTIHYLSSDEAEIRAHKEYLLNRVEMGRQILRDLSNQKMKLEKALAVETDPEKIKAIKATLYDMGQNFSQINSSLTQYENAARKAINIHYPETLTKVIEAGPDSQARTLAFLEKLKQQGGQLSGMSRLSAHSVQRLAQHAQVTKDRLAKLASRQKWMLGVGLFSTALVLEELGIGAVSTALSQKLDNSYSPPMRPLLENRIEK